MKNILILGGDSKIANLIKNLHLDIYASDFSFYYHTRRPGLSNKLTFNLMDLQQAISSISMLNISFDAILNLAGETKEKNSLNNSELSMNCCFIAEYFKIPLVFLTSSSAVYGNHKDCFAEEDDCIPLSVYGKSKLDMENKCMNHFSNKLDICCLRIGNFYGADQLCQNILMSKAVELDQFEDQMSSCRTYINASTFIDVILKLVNHNVKLPKVLNVGQPGKIFMRSILDYHNYDYKIIIRNMSQYQKILLDIKKLKKIIGKKNLSPFVIQPLKL